jgi:hypothetical protein
MPIVKALAIAALLILLPSGLGAAVIDPEFRFSSILTEHFAIHYHQGLEGLAAEAAGTAEEVHCLLSDTFRWEPGERTHVVLIDSTDFSNGLTTVLPYNAIYIFTTPPMADMSIGEYRDWFRRVIIHEYAHVLTMDAARGYPKAMRTIFGKPLPGFDPLSATLFLLSAPPNVFMPYWWLEGMATWAETEYDPGGRGKGSYYEMIYRAAVAEDNLPSIDDLNGHVPSWPSGSIPYIWGLALKSHIARHYGNDAPGRLSVAHSGRAPFFISAPASRLSKKGSKKLSKKGYTGLYRAMLDELKDEQKNKIEALGEVPFSVFETIYEDGEVLTNPRFSRDGALLALNRKDPHGHEGIVILEGGSMEIKTFIRRLPSDHNIAWSPGGDMIFFTQADLERGYNLYQDLYSFGIKERKTRRLTNGLRVKDADLSPDGRRFALVKVGPGGQGLALLNSGGEKTTVRTVESFSGMRVSGPRWSPDSRRIVFSVKDRKGNSAIMLHDAEAESTAVLLKDGYDNIHPTWSPNGRFVIFSSDRTGVFNLYAHSIQEGKTYQVTHLLGGAFQPEVSPDGRSIMFSSYGSRGFSIARMRYAPDEWKARPEGPSVSEDWPAGPVGMDEQEPAGGKCEAGAKGKGEPEGRPYSAAKSLMPRFWLPTLSADHEGGVLGAFTAAQDVLGYHTFIAGGGYGSSGHGYYDVTYIYDRLTPTLFLMGYSTPVLYSDFSCGDDLYEKETAFTAGVSIPVKRRLESAYSLLAGLQLKRQRWLEGPEEVFEGRRNNLFVGLEFDNSLTYPYSISREEGRTVSAYFRDYSGEVGSEVDSREYVGSYKEYLGFAEHNVIYLALKGAASEGERVPQQAFRMGGIPDGIKEFPLRGYPSGFTTGRYIATATVEYRRPLKYIFRGLNTKPFYLDRLHMAAFTDAGIVWSRGREFKADEADVGVGVELRLDIVLGYKLHVTPALGAAKGISGGGEERVYLTIYVDM